MKPPQPLVSIGLVFFLSCFSCFPDLSARERAVSFYVSPAGDDQWSGRLPSVNRNGTDGPFATLDRARHALRLLIRGGGIPRDGATVYIRGGVYPLSQTFKLTAEDSGTKDAPIVWRAYPGEEVKFIGGKPIAGFHSIRDSSVLRRTDVRFRDKILQVDLKGQGITNYGEITQRESPGMELFFQERRMTLARWPNQGWERIADVPQSGEKLFNEGLEREKRFAGVPVGKHYGRITYDGDRPKRWSVENEIYLHGYWTWDWSDSYQKVKSIDTVKHELTLREPHHPYGYTKNQRYYFLNVLEEVDTTGEWYLDRERGVLYFWPPASIIDSTVYVSLLDAPMLWLDGAHYVTIQGIHLLCSRGQGVVIKGGSNNLVAGCRLTCLGNDAVVVDEGIQNGILSCDIYDVALGGIRLKGGDRKSLTPSGNFAKNNHIHDYGAWVRTGQYAIIIDGVGNTLSHNLIHDAPFEGVYLKGNDHLVEYNEIHHVTQETGDAGAIHTGRDWTWRGNVIRYNYFHHLQGPGLHGVVAVYLDDWASDFSVYGNVFYKAGRAVEIGGGRDNRVENNTFVQCAPSVHVDARGLGWASYYFDGSRRELLQKMEEVKFKEPPYSKRYPELLTLYDDQPAVPKNNTIVRNVSFGGRWVDLYDYDAYDFSVVTMRDNLIADPLLCRRRLKGEKGWDPYYLDIDRKEGYVTYEYGDGQIMDEFRGNMILNTDPGFVGLDREDFRLKEDSPAYSLGFKRIPFETIGLYHDEYRTVVDKQNR